MAIDDIINLFLNSYPNRTIVRMAEYNSSIIILAPEKDISVDYSDPFFIVEDDRITPFLPTSVTERNEMFYSFAKRSIYEGENR